MRPRRTGAPVDRDPVLRAVLRGLLLADWQSILPDHERAAAVARCREQRGQKRPDYAPNIPITWAEAERRGLLP